MTLHADGGIVIGGDFDSVNGLLHGFIGPPCHGRPAGSVFARNGGQDRALAFRCDSMLAAVASSNFRHAFDATASPEIHTQDPSLSCLCAPEFSAAGLNRIGSRVTPRKESCPPASG